MQLWGVLFLLALIPVERSEAHGSSAASGSGHLDLGPWGLGGQSLAELVRGRGRFGGSQQDMWVEVRASSANSPLPGGEAINELTVAVRAKQPIWKIRLSLPERQLCSDPKVCLGYRFHEAKGTLNECDIVPWNYDKLKLPKSKLQVVDVQKQGLVDSCQVSNKKGDGGLGVKRSEMIMTIRQDVVADLVTDAWLVFKIKVLNPPETPVELPGSTQKANTWKVQLESEGGVLGKQSLPAPVILALWYCSYTNWMWTTPCTAKCGGGVRYSIRRLLHPPPLSYPRSLLLGCNEPLSQTHPCNEDPCIVDCKLGDWTRFADGPCSVTCGKGFQVERRRVVEGPVGKGKLCPAHNSVGRRVRYKECIAEEKECKPRCDLTEHAVLYGECNDICAGVGTTVGHKEEEGTRDSVRTVRRKETTATMKSCGAEYKKVPCGIKCDPVNFLPAESGRLPRMGKWAEMVLVFFLDDMAAGIRIESPRGFDMGKIKDPDSADHLCLLKSHNLPRLKRCVMSSHPVGGAHATFELHNSIEGMYVTESGGARQQMYEVVFWVKLPSECVGGFDEHGVCKMSEDTSKWKLQTSSTEDGGSTVEDKYASFKLYNEQAKDWSPVEEIHLNAEELHVQKQEFLMGVESKKQKEKKGDPEKSGRWMYVHD